jgi:SET domain-containing protein
VCSCSPNAQLSYGEGDYSATLISIADIKAGEEVFINYTDIAEPSTIVRQLKLYHYGFQCGCERCLKH